MNYLKDRVDPKYKEMFREASNAVKQAQKNQWPQAKKSLNLSQSIMFDHKIPKSIIEKGYADEIEYIKLNPTSEKFNATIKRSSFDQPLLNLIDEFERSKTLDAKANVVTKMNKLKNDFSKKYGGYLDEVSINVDKTGKPIFTSSASPVTKKTDLVSSLGKSMTQTGEITEKQAKRLLASMGSGSCAVDFGAKGNKDGGRIGYKVGTKGIDQCADEAVQLINSGMRNANSTQLKNFAAFANRAKNLGRNVMKFGIIPEAMYVAADATIRLTMGDKPTEALLRASEYLLPGDQTKLAEMMEATRLMNPETAAIIGRSIDYKNQLAKIDSLTSQRDNLENLSGGGEFDYVGDLNQDVLNLNNQIKQATDALNTKFKMTDAEQIYADAMQAEVDDRRKSKSLLNKNKIYV